jgi:Gas vesicle protein
MNDDQSLTENLKEEDGQNAEGELLSPDIERVSLCEVLDRTLNKGAVVAGDVMISVADINLIYLGLQLVITSVSSLSVNRK